MTFLADSKPVSFLQSHIDELLAQINATHQPVAITGNGETKPGKLPKPAKCD